MRVLVACEYSGTVRDAFRERGHDAWSCDILPSESVGNHIQGDVSLILNDGWDLMIAHPPCTYLARSGMKWLKDQPPLKSGKLVGADRRKALADAIEFFKLLLDAPIPKIAIENPRSHLIPFPATQYVQPWQFDHGETKETGLWLRNLPPLMDTIIAKGREARIHMMPPGENRSKERSLTYSGLAKAMAHQWG